MEDLLSKQQAAMRSVELALENFKKLGRSKYTYGHVRNRLSSLKDTFSRCQNLHDQLVIHADSETRKNEYFTADRFLECEDAYNAASDYMTEFLVQLEPQQSPSAAHVSLTHDLPVRSSFHLPRINLPSFSGQLSEWESFRDRFSAMVIHNADLPNISKLHYLGSSLSGEASELLRHLIITDANFKVAWDLLSARYENKRRLISVHLHALNNLPQVHSESANKIRMLRDKANTSIQALKNLDRSVDRWGDMLVYLVTRNLDKSSRKAWELKLGDTVEFLDYNELDKFLESRIRALEAILPLSSASTKKLDSSSKSASTRHVNSHAATSSRVKCPMCQSNHFLYLCPSFKEKPPYQRADLIKKWQRCINCFSSKHRTNECVIASTGRRYHPRALLDQGSVATFITERLVQRLRTPRTRVSASIAGIGDVQASARHTVNISIAPQNRVDPAYPTTALVLSTLTRYLPDRVEKRNKWSHLKDLQLADADPMSSTPIDVIIGADLYGLLILEGVRKGSPDEPLAQNTSLGWIISGPTSSTSTTPSLTIQSHHGCLTHDLDNELRRFWDVEELPRKTYLTPKEQKCENHFISTHSRTADGKYVVRLPFKEGPPINIGESKAIARSMLLRSEKRLHANPKLHAAYSEFLTEYESSGHMSKVCDVEPSSSQVVYIPHHAVLRSNSTTTRTRVVFNVSAPTSNKTSLNDHMLIGPKLQTDLPSVILRWKQFRYVYTADVAKMYRQILVNPRDVDYQRILWRSSPTDPISEFRLLTITYGTASAPYQALRVLQQLAADDGAEYPLALKVLRRHIYVDDCVFGSDDPQLAIQTRDQLIALLSKAGFVLRKWASNHPDLLSDIDPHDHGLAHDKPLRVDEGIKILGITWNPEMDAFHFQVTLTPVDFRTKRDILSLIAKIFDPLGWITPVVITAKIFMQKLWLLKGGWDDPLSTELKEEWLAYYSKFSTLKKLSIPRWTEYGSDTSQCELHGFADASTLAYAAVVYLRVTTTSGQVTISLLAAKSKVAPIKSQTVPRFELCAAHLLARTMLFVRTALDLPQIPCHCWTDSTITLTWLSQHPSRWQTFVANRAADIQSRLPLATWRHVPTSDNPADCASRGFSVPDLLEHPLWWNGPSWLAMPPNSWPHHSSILERDAPLEKKANVYIHIAQPLDQWDLANRFSSWLKLLRITAHVVRFTKKVRLRRQPQNLNEPEPLALERASRFALLPSEIQEARIIWLRRIQEEQFAQERRSLLSHQPLPKKSSLLPLNPFMDNQNLIRVGGRLEKSDLPTNAKHPIILASHPLVSLIIQHVHIKSLHAGPQLTLRLLRDDYWIVRARQTVRAVLFTCVTCARQKAVIPSELMGSLPEVRVTRASRSFLHCGLDYAGPFFVRTTPGRGHKSTKAYIALFVCMATRAIHLELVRDYSTATFLAAFRRFSSRRGLPNAMYSDNGTTFVGADRELAASFRAVTRDPTLTKEFTNDQVTWHFLPPSAPHFEGLWEAGVRSVKYHFKRVVGTHTLTFEEFTTLLHQVEACMNSRPIAPLSDRIDDYVALTPGHFLIGAAPLTVPEPSLLELKDSRLSRWQLVRQMYERIWESWSRDYLHTLQQRTKWRFARNNVKVGQIVLLRNSLAPPCKWELGRITRCHPGDDGLTRVVTVKTANSEHKRPIVKLCLLPINLDDSQDANVLMAGGDSPVNGSASD